MEMRERMSDEDLGSRGRRERGTYFAF